LAGDICWTIGSESDQLRGKLMRGLISIVIGVIFIWGGLSGNLALRGTKSGPALAVVGIFLVGLGIYRIAKT
jgi:hypothetical protein